MSDINQVGNNSNDCDSLNISALEFNPSASNVSEDIENLLVDESISESENENKYASEKKRDFGIVPKFLYAYGCRISKISGKF